MKVTLLLFMFVFMISAFAKPVSAHQPRIVSDTFVEITNPEVSQAFYATLQGRPDEYQIDAEEELTLHVSLLVPALPDIRKDFTVNVYQVIDDAQPEKLYALDGKQHTWEPFYEPFAGDNYLQGPESDRVLPAGVYRIIVSNPDNAGKYVLSVGRDERFTLNEVIQTIQRLPAVKRFFEKSPWTAYFNLMGVFMVLSLLLLITVVFGAYRITASLLKR